MSTSAKRRSKGSPPFSAFAAIFTAAFCVSPPFLNMFVNYTLPGGSVLEKFHPSTYLVIGLFMAVSVQGIPPYGPNARNYLFLFATIFVSIVSIAFGNFGYFSILADIFVAPCLFVVAASTLRSAELRALMRCFIYVAAFNILLVAWEFFTRSAFLPYEQEVAFFRPAGIFGHPIATGTICCIAMLGCRRVIENLLLRRILSGLLLCQVAMCGVRGPLLVGAFLFILDILNGERRQRPTDYFYSLFFLVALAGVGMAFQNLAVFDRILARGIWDSSAASRFDIFNIFSIMSDAEFWFGTSPERMIMYAQILNQTRIENSFVVAVYQLGFIPALLMFISLVLYFRRPAAKSIGYLAILIMIALSTLYFGVKSVVNYPLFLLGYLLVSDAYDLNKVGVGMYAPKEFLPALDGKALR